MASIQQDTGVFSGMAADMELHKLNLGTIRGIFQRCLRNYGIQCIHVGPGGC